MVCDSVTRALVYPQLENATGSFLRQVNAYTPNYDEQARHPDKNVMAVVQMELAKAEYHTVILGAPSVTITNQDVSDGIMDENMAETLASSQDMVDTAEYIVKSGRAKQVILLQHIPRFDIEENDPMGVRPELARLANMELERARDASSQAQHIMVGQHAGLECEGKSRVDRFTSNHTYGRNKNVRMGKYDGLHMYSQEGAEALTKSLLTIFHTAGMVRRPERWSLPSSSSPSSASSEEWSGPRTGRGFQRENRGNNGNRQGNRGNNGQFQIPVKNMFQNFC